MGVVISLFVLSGAPSVGDNLDFSSSSIGSKDIHHYLYYYSGFEQGIYLF